jgi:acetylglutamate kinase
MQKKPLYIVKISGNTIDNSEALEQFLKDFHSLQFAKILIHGGGKIATEIAKKMEIPTQMIDGRRITDEATIDLVTMVYGGLINKKIVGKLQSLQTNAIGLTGADAGSVISEKRPIKDIDYGFVGDIKKVNSATITKLIEIGLVPIFAPLTSNSQGQILNTNADTMAKEIAVAMSENFDVNLIYCFEKNGVLSDINDEMSVIEKLDFAQYQIDKKNGIVNKGMIPKLDNAFEARNEGVNFVSIINAENLEKYGTEAQIGTVIL